MSQIIAMDVGGSSVKSGLVDTNLTVTHTQKTAIDSKGSADTILDTLADIITTHLEQAENIIGVGFGFPSPFEYDKGIARIKGLEKFESIYGMNIGDEIRLRLNHADLTIIFRNDAEAAIVGEAKFGAGKNFRRLIGVTLGTGLGSSFIVDGKRVTSGAGVPSHEGFLFPELYKGERVDDLFSTRGLLARFSVAGLNITHVSDAKSAADNGDEVIREIFAQFGSDLADFLKGFAFPFEAEAILVLGGISGAFEHFQSAMETVSPVPVKCGELGSTAALIGAIEPLLPQE